MKQKTPADPFAPSRFVRLRKWGLRFAALACIVCVFASMPYVLPRLPSPQVKATEPPFQGLLRVWVMQGVAERGQSWLSANITRFENTFKGVYVQVDVVAQKDIDRLLTQYTPDLVIFGAGQSGELPALEIIAAPDLIDAYRATGEQNGEQLALPLFAEGYVLVYATQATSEPADFTALESALHVAKGRGKVERFALQTAGLDYNLSLAALMQYTGEGYLQGAATRRSKTLPGDFALAGPESAFNAFITGKSAMNLITFAQLARLVTGDALAPDWALAPLPDALFTDRVGYIARPQKEMAENRRHVVSSLLEYLLSDAPQTRLSSYRLLSPRASLNLYAGILGDVETAFARRALLLPAFDKTARQSLVERLRQLVG